MCGACMNHMIKSSTALLLVSWPVGLETESFRIMLDWQVMQQRNAAVTQSSTLLLIGKNAVGTASLSIISPDLP